MFSFFPETTLPDPMTTRVCNLCK